MTDLPRTTDEELAHFRAVFVSDWFAGSVIATAQLQLKQNTKIYLFIHLFS